jgi:hypothetical protein
MTPSYTSASKTPPKTSRPHLDCHDSFVGSGFDHTHQCVKAMPMTATTMCAGLIPNRNRSSMTGEYHG